MAQALYRKYRPTSFDEVIGQSHITDTLRAALKNGQLSHAYLFTGPRGVGKTSVARILAYEANGLKYGDATASLDIIEIDGASNRRIEEVRDLRDKVHILPSSGKYKVYIIDEVHMLTKEAFNALLKTLEEPPAHCIFILATTEAHKVPETIVSRTQRFTFKPIAASDLIDSLQATAKKEKVKVEPEALELLAKHGQGSFRDSISLLDQLHIKDGSITADFVRQVIGIPPADLITSLCELVRAGDTKNLLSSLDQLQELNINPSLIAKSVSEILRTQARERGSSQQTIRLLKDLLEVSGSSSPQDRLEVALLEAAELASTDAPKDKESDHHDKPEASRPADKPTPASKPKQSPPPAMKQKIESSDPKKINFDLKDWPKLLDQVGKRKPVLLMALKFALPQIEEGKLHLFFEFPLYKKKVDVAEHRKLISQVLKDKFGDELSVACNVDKDRFAVIKPLITELTQKDAKIYEQTISSIFGGGEVLESSVSI